MQLEGKVWKDGKFWLAEIPALDYLTQGRTKREALRMAADIVKTGVDQRGFKVAVSIVSPDTFTLRTNDPAALIAHLLRRIRQKNGLTVREASRRLGSSSPNAFGAYEQGHTKPTLDKLEQLVRAISPHHRLTLKFA